MDEMMEAIRKQFGYMLSLPERTMRSLAAIASGTTSLLTEALVPETLRGSTFYKVLLGDMQRFVSEQVAQIPKEPGAAPAGETAAEDYVQRKVAGSALETAGLLAMHISPLWVFALAGDAAEGSSVFLNRLVEQLKQNGVVPKDTQINGLTDLLAAVQDTTRHSASAINTPPLSREDLTKLSHEMTESYRQMFAKARDLLPRLNDMWARLTSLAKRENVSLERLSGILAVDVAETGRRGVGAVLSVGQTGADLIGEKILTSYAHTLDAMTQQGVSNYISAQMKPFVEAARNHFDPGRPTWTEKKLGLAAGAVSAGSDSSGESTEEPFPPPPPVDPGATSSDPFPPPPPHDGPAAV